MSVIGAQQLKLKVDGANDVSALLLRRRGRALSLPMVPAPA
jgi:hypothetical protein